MDGFSDLEGVKVPVEVQIKTEAMSIAQDTIHDSLYKKKEMPKEIRGRLSRVIFPIIENMAQIDGFIDKSNPKTKKHLIQDVKQIKLDNIEILRQYSDILKIVNQQYKDIILIKKREKTIELQDFLTQGVKSELEEKTAEFHDQKSEQFFEDIESGKYNVPPSYIPKDSNLEQNDNLDIDQQNNSSLVEYKPNRLKMFFTDLVGRIKSSNLYQRVMNNEKNEQIDNESIDRATEKMEMERKKFENSLIVSKEEQEKNRQEYEQSKQKSASISHSKEKDGDERY